MIIAATLTSSGSRNWKLVAEIRRLRKEMDLPRIPSPKKPPASPAPKPEKKASPGHEPAPALLLGRPRPAMWRRNGSWTFSLTENHTYPTRFMPLLRKLASL